MARQLLQDRKLVLNPGLGTTAQLVFIPFLSGTDLHMGQRLNLISLTTVA